MQPEVSSRRTPSRKVQMLAARNFPEGSGPTRVSTHLISDHTRATMVCLSFHSPRKGT